MELQWWIAVIGVPLVSSIFGLMLTLHAIQGKAITKLRDDTAKNVAEHRRAADMGIISMRDDLNSFKLRVAENYVSNSDVRALEERIISWLEKLDAKIDKLAERP